jgi:hypothetical protein
MSRSIRLAVCLFTLVCTGEILAQSPDIQTDESVSEASASTPVAHVYVGSGSQILAFSAAANGKLTPVSGSPFNYNESLMGANGHFLFGFEPGTLIIDSLSMAANGALKKVASTNTENYWPDPTCPMVTWNGQGFRIDHSGLDLYNAGIPGDFGCYSAFQSYKIDDANGKLTYLGETDGIFNGGPQMSILGNDEFAYSVVCEYPFGNGATPEITAFQRLSSGELVTAKAGVAIPAAPTNETDANGPTPGYYCPINMATDPTNHAAITYFAVDQNGVQYGPGVIATYTADAKGNLTTTSTYKNMATLPTSSDGTNTSCTACGALRMAPSGKLLAAGGSAGLLLFHFNGGSQPTKYKTLLANDGIGSILWDNDNHLYALGSDAKGSKLWVYTVTPTSVTEAPGSPYSIANAGGMYVQPLP